MTVTGERGQSCVMSGTPHPRHATTLSSSTHGGTGRARVGSKKSHASTVGLRTQAPIDNGRSAALCRGRLGSAAADGNSGGG